MTPAVVALPIEAEKKKSDPIRDLMLKGITLPEIAPEVRQQLEGVKADSNRRVIEIELATVALGGRKIESLQRDYPGVDLTAMLEAPDVSARVDAWSENPVVENYARDLQERRLIQKAMSALDACTDNGVTLGQAQELIAVLTKGRQVRDPEKPVRRLHFVMGQANIETPFGRCCLDVHGRHPAEAFIDVCRAMNVRNDAEIAAVLDCLRTPMSRIALAGW